MIDSNGKLFGKVSIVDIVVVLAVVILAVGVYVRFFGGPSDTVVKDSVFYYSFSVEGVRDASLAAMKKNIGGNFILNEKITGEMGKLIKVEEREARADIKKVNGELVYELVPNRYDVTMTFEITGKVNDRGYFSPSLEHISGGVFYNLKGKYVACYGTILSVWAE